MLPAVSVAVILQNPAGGSPGSGLNQGLRIPPASHESLPTAPGRQRQTGCLDLAGGAVKLSPAVPTSGGPIPRLHQTVGCAHTSRPKGHSHSCHTLILEGDEGHVEPLQRDAVAFSVELICELLLQFPIVLLSIHLWEQPGLRHGQATLLPAVLPTLGPCCLAVLPSASYLLKATEAAAEDPGTRVGFDHDLSLFLCLGGEVKPSLHCLTPAGKQRGRFFCLHQTDRYRVPMYSPLCIQLHQLAHIEAELYVGDSAAGIGLTVGTWTWWHQRTVTGIQTTFPLLPREARVGWGHPAEMRLLTGSA